MGGTARLGLAGDTMLGRGVGAAIRWDPGRPRFSPEVLAAAARADAVVLNLECCLSTRGARWPAPGKPFFFRGPPEAVGQLRALGTSCVTLANNHALDYGEVALLDTLEHLARAGIAAIGAGRDVTAAREPQVVRAGGLTIAVVAFADHPADFAAGDSRPGTAYAPLDRGLPAWVAEGVAAAAGRADLVLVTPHWGPNMTGEPVPSVRAAGRALLAAGASLVAGHSAHVFHGVEGAIMWDLGDLIDDYAVDPVMRNDRGLLWTVTLDAAGPVRAEALPLQLEPCFTRAARGTEPDWIEDRLRRACDRLGTRVDAEGDLLVVTMR